MLRNLFESRKALAGEGEDTPFAITGATTRRLGGGEARQHLQTYGGDSAIDWVMDCVDLYAQTGSNAGYYFHDPVEPGKDLGSIKPQPVETPPQDLVNLFNHPNPYMEYGELFELAIIDLLVAGEFFWLKFRRGNDPASPQYGKPLALYRLSPALVEIVLDENDKPDYVEWRAPGHGAPIKFKPEDVVHVRRPNPHDSWRGLPIIAASPHVMEIELAVTEAMKSYYDHGAMPSGTLESDRTVPPSTWKKVKRQFRQLYQGSSQAGSVIMLERGLKWTPMGSNGKDAAYADIANLSMSRIARAFRVPLPLLGEVGGTDRQSIREAQRIFDNKVMRPFLNRIQRQVSMQLTQAWDLDYYVDYEYVMPIEDKLDLAEGASTLPGITTKEVRGLIDLKPLAEIDGVEDGEKIDNMVLNLPGQNDPTGHGQGGFPDRAIGSEPGRPPNPENTKPFPQDGQPLPAGSAAIDTKKSDPAAALRRDIRKMRRRLREVKS